MSSQLGLTAPLLFPSTRANQTAGFPKQPITTSTIESLVRQIFAQVRNDPGKPHAFLGEGDADWW